MKRWRTLLLIACMLLGTMVLQVPAQAAAIGSPVRVGLYYGSTALPEVRFSSANGLMLGNLQAAGSMPQPFYTGEGEVSWAVRPDAYRLQFGPYDNLTSANSAMASLKGDDTLFVVQELGKYYVRFGGYNSPAVAEQLLKLMTSQPGVVIGPYRAASGMQADLTAAKTWAAQVEQVASLPATVAWVGNGWQVLVGNAVSAAGAAQYIEQLEQVLPAESWTVKAPDWLRSQVYSVNGELLCSIPAGDVYIGAIGAELGNVENPCLITLHNGSIAKRYRGFTELTLQNNGLYRVLLYLTIEQYIMGVLPAESYTSWPMEAQKAQAVTMRTWSEVSRGKHASDGFDFCTTTNCQVYVDFSRETELTKQAVLQTSGRLITYQGKPVSVYYSADAGGYSESVENVWAGSSPLPWLRGVPEIFPDESPYAKWSKSFTGAELSALLRKNAIDIGTVVSVQVTGYSEAGRVMGLKLADKAGKTVTLTGEGQLRLFYSLGSRKYTVQADIPSVSVLGAEGQVVQVSPTGLKVATAGGVVSNLDRTDAYRIQGASSTVSSNASALGFVFVGSGAGHGAGLSQWGAYSMAKNGISYDQILKHYFQGTEILQLGD